MKRQSKVVLTERLSCRSLFAALLSAIVLSATVYAQNSRDSEESLLSEEEYRSELEEIVVVGQEPEWRKKMTVEEEWRPERFKLPDVSRKPRLQWFPEYTKDERDNYDGVRDRTGENPEFKLFEWKF